MQVSLYSDAKTIKKQLHIAWARQFGEVLGHFKYVY